MHWLRTIRGTHKTLPRAKASGVNRRRLTKVVSRGTPAPGLGSLFQLKRRVDCGPPWSAGATLSAAWRNTATRRLLPRWRPSSGFCGPRGARAWGCCLTSPQRCWRHPGPFCQSPRRGSLRATSAAAGPFGGLAGLAAALCGVSRHTDDGAAFRLGRLPPTWRSRARRSSLRSLAHCPRSASPTAPCATPSLGGRGAPGSGAGRLDACCSAASAPASGASGRVWQLQAGDAVGGVACGGSSRGTGAAADAL